MVRVRGGRGGLGSALLNLLFGHFELRFQGVILHLQSLHLLPRLPHLILMQVHGYVICVCTQCRSGLSRTNLER